MTVSPSRWVIIILVAGAIGSFLWFRYTFSADLMATWLAANFADMGRLDQVYPAMTEHFMMYPPSEWRDWMAVEYDYEGPVYPFLYPPLWLKVSQFYSGANFWIVSYLAVIVNSTLQMATIALAFWACKPKMHPALFAGLGVFFLLGTHIGTISLQQNQPQILVSFLLVLAVERVRNDAPIVAGIALAIAASMKMYPALFALFWLFGREYRALLSFFVFGTVLGLLSILWAGWPLHVAFLEQVRLISGSVLVTAISLNLDGIIAQVFFKDWLVWVPALEAPTVGEPDPGWYSMERPIAWQIMSSALLLGAVFWIALKFRDASRATQASLLWPLAFTVVALLSPLTWVYYYIPACCFAAILLERLELRKGILFLIGSFFLIFGPFVSVYRTIEEYLEDYAFVPFFLNQVAGTISMTVLACGLYLAYKRTRETVEIPTIID